MLLVCHLPVAELPLVAGVPVVAPGVPFPVAEVPLLAGVPVVAPGSCQWLNSPWWLEPGVSCPPNPALSEGEAGQVPTLISPTLAPRNYCLAWLAFTSL